MKIPFVDLGAQYLTIKDEIDGAIASVLRRSSFVGGKEVEEFEESFASYVGVTNCVSCANGTDAIEIALEVLGIGIGDEVLVPANTWVSTASAVSRVGAKPVFVDVHPDFYTVDVDKISRKITSRTKAIIPVHFYGLPADMKSINALARKSNLYVIEDCAQAHGAKIHGQRIGSFGDIAAFSFYPGKNLGAYGDGGAVVTNSKDMAEKARIIARLGQQGKHNHVAIGRNSRLDSLQAGILQVKLNHIDSWSESRQRVAQWYKEGLKNSALKLPQIPAGFSHVYHLYVVQVENREALQKHLQQKGISTQIHYPKPLHKLEIFKEQSQLPIAETMSDHLLSLPMYAELATDQVHYVTDVIKEYVG